MRINLLLVILICFISLSAFESDITIKKTTFKGNKQISNKELKTQLIMREPSLFEKLNVFKKKETFDTDYLDRDLMALIYYYQKKGFLKVAIDQELKIKQKSYQVTYLITENHRIIIDSLTVKLVNSDSLEKNLQYKLHKYSHKKYSDQLIQEITLFLSNYLLENSYLNYKINPEFNINTDSTRVKIIFQIKTGSKYLINKINYHELSYVNKKVLEHQIPLADSFYYKPEKVAFIKKQLSQLNLFQSINIETNPLEEKTAHIPLEVYLKEYPKRQFKAGLGYGLEDHFRAFLDYTILNFGGNARQVKLNTKTSALEPWNISLKIQEPLPFRYSMYSLINPYWLSQKEDVYEINRIGILFGYTQDLSTHHSYQIYYLFEQNNLISSDVFESDSLQSVYNKSSVLVNYNTNFIKQDKGLMTYLSLIYSGLNFNSRYDFFKVISDNRYYLPLSRLNSLAFKAKYGKIQSFDFDKIIPVEERFYAGGSNSIRGWARNEISPINQYNEKTGGNSLLELSLENRTLIYPKIEFALFYDCGNVWESNIKWKSILSSVGTGIRYYSLLGPIRLDFARPLFDKKKSVQYYIQIGQSF